MVDEYRHAGAMGAADEDIVNMVRNEFTYALLTRTEIVAYLDGVYRELGRLRTGGSE